MGDLFSKGQRRKLSSTMMIRVSTLEFTLTEDPQTLAAQVESVIFHSFATEVQLMFGEVRFDGRK